MPDTAKPGSNVRVWGSDVIAAAIREQGFPYVALNPGASYRGVHDSLVNYLGNETPKMLVCLHEEHALSIAQGYATVTDEPIAAFVHSNVGLLHATMGVFDAWCARKPVVIFGATGPVDAAKRRPWIDWIHTTSDQGALIRNFSKWDNQPGSAAACIEAIRRATIIARTRPCGPVYVNFDAEIQEEELNEWPSVHEAASFNYPAPPAPNAADLDKAVEWLNGAKKIVMFAGRMSRDETAWKERIALAEALGAHVICGNTPAAFPSKHPLFEGEAGYTLRPDIRDVVKSADAILVLDYVDAGGTINQVFATDAPRKTKIINVTMDHQLHNGFGMEYHILPISDLSIATTAEAFTTAALAKVKKRPDAMRGRTSAYSLPAMPTAKGEIGIRDLAATFLNLTDGMDICLMGRSIGWPPNATAIAHPHDWIGESHGGGVGAGPGIAVGAALALRDMGSPRLPVMVCGDGDYTMGCNALWTAANAKIPLLIIVANNRAYFNDELHQQTVAKIRDRPQENAWVGQRIEDPAPDMAAIAKGFGLDGAGPIEKLEDLPKALETAFKAVKAGKSYVLDVVTKREYAANPINTRKT